MSKGGSQRDIMVKLYKKFKLTEDDIHKSKHFNIITRAGIQKIEAASTAQISFEPMYNSDEHVRLLFTAVKKDENSDTIKITTTGEASVENVQQRPKYLAAMAEKRGRSRAILTIEGLYKEGFYGQDEAEEFDKTVKEAQKQAKFR